MCIYRSIYVSSLFSWKITNYGDVMLDLDMMMRSDDDDSRVDDDIVKKNAKTHICISRYYS